MPLDDMLAEMTADAGPIPDLRAQRRPVVETRCTHLGGSAPCQQFTTTCVVCRVTSYPCRLRPFARTSDGHPVCDGCLDRTRCEVCALYGECRCRRSVISAYHSERPYIALEHLTPTSEPLVGCEIECVWPGSYAYPGASPDAWISDRLAPALHGLDPIVLAVERDSSLGSEGTEIVTRPLPLSILRETLPTLLERIAAAGAVTDSRCGGHIHVSATRRVLAGAARLAGTYGHATQAPVWEAIAGRSVDTYRSIGPEAVTMEPSGSLPSHRSAIHRSPHRTVEWRHPSGTLDARLWIARAELFLDMIAHASAEDEPTKAWGIGQYVRDRSRPEKHNRYAWALMRSIGFHATESEG